MTVTVGVSIAIPEPYGQTLRDKRRSYGDVMADRIPSHITLAPPLVVDESGMDDLGEDLRELTEFFRPFTVSLLGTGTFRPISPVVFVAVSQGIAQIETLAEGVRKAIGAPEPEFPFHPHVTVAHHVPDEALDTALEDLVDFRCTFEVEAIHLYVDEPETGWVPTSAFPLG
ncbi:2'-5' RNA ligase family protein [Aeromicrobium duanguangcaii]|uniref:2'-5' RNA ligase family protein n=1 Tax=Aeromicrobium duanguangcaii TaxID=2968086 RepID=A0ABY5KG09_9ACTN|nr:2'-5' RNA ligase family protein [Aeromicrobium duanguangcaii]MCD9155289.1 2'-5' RNA ligase family protein [Aeromicrobium duanguangcaii]UUI68062.1 2'-5' RNA ligase family protein [Aeromicrobium duanguangcaii]